MYLSDVEIRRKLPHRRFISPYLGSGLGHFGCGPGGTCTQCRESGVASSIGEASPATQHATPVFEVQCPDGCPPVAAGQCRAIVRAAIVQAIRLANHAADKIEAATNLQPSQRDADARETARLFKFFFGHDPTRPVPWAGNQASGTSIAVRYRAVARELGGGRRMIFRCLATRPGCADADFTCCASGAYAWVNQARVPNVVHLCSRFWDPPADLPGLPPLYIRAGTIIHEMLHLLFQDFLQHSPPGRPNAYCYDAFAMRIAGFGANRSDVDQCRSTAAGGTAGFDGSDQLVPLTPTTLAPPRGFDPLRAAREAAERMVPFRPETPEERIQRILKEPVPTLPGGTSLKEWLDTKMAERNVPKWLRDSIWTSFIDKNWGVMSNLLSQAGFRGAIKTSIIETARGLMEVKVR